MGMVIVEYGYVFDDVQFAIDLKAARAKLGVSQLVVAQALGYTTAGVINRVENAAYARHLSLTDYVKLCQLFDLDPHVYFDFQRASTLDMFKKLG